MTLVGFAARLLAAHALVLAATAADGGLALGPALIMVRDVPTGRAFSLGEHGPVRWQVHNRSSKEMTIDVRCTIPDAYSFGEFEKGYEPPPDGAWFRLDRTRVTIPPLAIAEVDLTVDIPDRPEFRNRHWIVQIDVARAETVVLGAALRLRARIMLETAVDAGVGDADARAGEIAVVPSVAAMRQDETAWRGGLAVRNNLVESAEFDLLHPQQVYAEITKAHRHFHNLREAVLEPWAVADAPSFTLAAGERRTLAFAAPLRAAYDGRREEVLFVARRARPSTAAKGTIEIGGRRYERMELIRLRYDPTATEGPTPAR